MDYSSDSDSENIVFVTEDGSAFSNEELEALLSTKINPHTGAPISESDITELHKLILEPEYEEIEYVDYRPGFRYPFLTLYAILTIQLGYIIWSVV